MYLVCTRMSGESYRRRLRSLLLYMCYVLFRALINSLVCWFSPERLVGARIVTSCQPHWVTPGQAQWNKYTQRADPPNNTLTHHAELRSRNVSSFWKKLFSNSLSNLFAIFRWVDNCRYLDPLNLSFHLRFFLKLALRLGLTFSAPLPFLLSPLAFLPAEVRPR